MILFEIHIFRDGAWKVDSVFDDKELAVYEAQRMEQTGRLSAVRVIEEFYDEATQRTRTRTVWRSSKVDKENLESGRRRAQASAVPTPPPRRRGPPKKALSPTMLVFKLVLIVLAGLLALVLLRYWWEQRI